MNIKSSKELVDKANESIKVMSAEHVKNAYDKGDVTLIDVRDIRELWKEGTIKGAIHIPRGMLEFWVDKESPYYQKNRFTDDKQIILFCALGARSALAAKTLQEMGFTNVSHVKGGYRAMAASGTFQLIKIKRK